VPIQTISMKSHGQLCSYLYNKALLPELSTLYGQYNNKVYFMKFKAGTSFPLITGISSLENLHVSGTGIGHKMRY